MNIPSISTELETVELTSYWPRFQKTAYALYDEDFVYLVHHPHFPDETVTQLPWSEEFVGNTLIMFREVPTAIVRAADCTDEAELVAVLIHEMFHGFQFLSGESRFPDEVQGILYPLHEENTALRMRERYHLYHAVLPTDPIARNRHLHQFVSCRERRLAILGESIRYELLIETIEGPAFYVESQAYGEQSGENAVDVLRKYGEGLLDEEDTVQHLRKSCCTSGIFLCYVLDRILPKWKESFFEGNDTLYSLVRKSVTLNDEAYEPIEIRASLRDLLTRVKKERSESFLEAEQNAAFTLTLVGTFKITGIDPMNIVADSGRALHRHFIRAEIGEETCLIRYPVLAEFKTRLLECHRLIVCLEEAPELLEHGIHVSGIGDLEGDYDPKTFTLTMTRKQ